MTISPKRVTTDGLCFSFHAGTLDWPKRPFSRFLGKKVFAPPPRSTCGVWPYEDAEEPFPDFIIGEDDFGGALRFSCDPNRLANYFGGNPDAPHYLTPVFFRRDVLQRYYEHPEKYSVEDGYLRCGGLWGIQIDNDSSDYVVVFLGDLGRDLPATERDYWRAFNVPPIGSMSETAFRRSFLSQFGDATAPDTRFKRAYVGTSSA